ncbi:MAG: hypothetical protein IPK03_16105 [Bacteroidetes bacterium]|nr:hypothetical protein [Bacteroidota bacterium]
MKQLKSYITILLLITYLVNSIGVYAQLHYCGGHLASITFVEHGQEKCPCGSKSMKKGCCKDKIVKSKIKDAHKNDPLAKIIFNLIGEFPIQKFVFYYYSDKKFASCYNEIKVYQKPPQKPKILSF